MMKMLSAAAVAMVLAAAPFGLRPAQAASIPPTPALADAAKAADVTEPVYWGYRRRYWGYRPYWGGYGIYRPYRYAYAWPYRVYRPYGYYYRPYGYDRSYGFYRPYWGYRRYGWRRRW